MDAARKRKNQSEMIERSYLQWNLMRSLAFGERDWILLCSILFWLSDTRDFLSWTGVTLMLLGIFFIGPVYGYFIHLISKAIYLRNKARGRLPKTIEAAKKYTWWATLVMMPFMVATSWYGFELYYESFDSLAKWSAEPMMGKKEQEQQVYY